MAEQDFHVEFWGARGTMASSSKTTDKYGGNTACLEIKCGEETLIFDAGSGLRLLGEHLQRNAIKNEKKGIERRPLNLFFTHCHYDHISGLPFFAPFFDPNWNVHIWSGHLPGPDKTERMVNDYMRSPFFPVGPEVFSAQYDYRDFEPEDVLKPVDGVEVKTMSLNHHDECIGYRVEFEGRSICFITDTTHVLGAPDEGIINFCRDTDLMIYDGMYTDAEFPTFADFGHSTWEEGARLAKQAGAKRYCIFHHRPSRSDADMDGIAKECKKMFRRSWAAYEGLKISV